MADAETVEFKGETINNKYIERLEKIIKEEWKVSSESASKDTTHSTDYKDSRGDAILIPIDKKEEYELLTELLDILKFDLTNKEEIYRMPLGEMPESMKEFDRAAVSKKEYKKETFEFFITKKGAEQLFKKHKEYKILLGIEFPQELFQLVKPAVNIPIPGISFPAPEPEKYKEGAEAYETRMLEYYREKGYEPQLNDAGRPPLPHEWVTYSDEVPKVNPTTPVARSSYKQHLEELHLTPDMSTDHAPKGLTEGERKKVKSTRPGHHLLTSLKFGRKELKGKNVLKGLAGIGLGAFGISKFVTMFGTGKIPAIVLGQAAVKLLIPIVVVLLATFLYKKYGKRFFRAAKKFIEDKIKGKRISEEDLEHEGDGVGSGGSDSDSGSDSDMDVEQEAQDLYEDLLNRYPLLRELRGKIQILEEEIAELSADPIKNADLIKAKTDEKNGLLKKEEEWWLEIHKVISPYVEAAHKSQEASGRGMGI